MQYLRSKVSPVQQFVFQSTAYTLPKVQALKDIKDGRMVIWIVVEDECLTEEVDGGPEVEDMVEVVDVDREDVVV